MTLAIVGSTSLAGNAEAERHIQRVLDVYRPDVLVSGGAVGIDTMAKRAALARDIRVVEFTPEVRRWDGGDRIGFKQRNVQIAEACDRLVRSVAAGSTTYGSGWTRDRAAALGKPTEEFVVRPATQLRA